MSRRIDETDGTLVAAEELLKLLQDGATMRRWRAHRHFLSTIVALLCFGCGPPTLDVSDPVAFGRSLAKLRQTLTTEDQVLLDESLVYLVGDAPSGPEVAKETPGEIVERFRPLGGLTADAIIAQAWIGRTHEVRTAIEGLESGREMSADARRQLALFRFDEVQVYKRNRGFLEWPVIEIKASNETNHMVYLIHFRAALLRSGEESPWLEEEFDHVVFDGLAPGERAVWRIEPKQREWIRLIDPHPELEFILEAMRLEALGGTVLTSADWGMVEARRLELYRTTLDRIESLRTLALDGPPLPESPGGETRDAEFRQASTAT